MIQAIVFALLECLESERQPLLQSSFACFSRPGTRLFILYEKMSGIMNSNITMRRTSMKPMFIQRIQNITTLPVFWSLQHTTWSTRGKQRTAVTLPATWNLRLFLLHLLMSAIGENRTLSKNEAAFRAISSTFPRGSYKERLRARPFLGRKVADTMTEDDMEQRYSRFGGVPPPPHLWG
jgi:hypothetical protein